MFLVHCTPHTPRKSKQNLSQHVKFWYLSQCQAKRAQKCQSGLTGALAARIQHKLWM